MAKTRTNQPDYEALAHAAGWRPYANVPGAWYRNDYTNRGPRGEVDMIGARSAKEACEVDGLCG